METLTEQQQDLAHELDKAVKSWVNKTFNFIQLEVVEKWSDNNLFEHIINASPSESFIDWLDEQDDKEMIEEFIDSHEITEYSYDDYDLTVGMTKKKAFINVFSQDNWDKFVNWALEIYSMDIEDYISEQENYPMWNLLFEFRDDWFNSEEVTQICQKLHLGIIEGLEPFNNIIFMMSCGHSFYGSYWIPLYLELYPDEKTKYENVKYDHL